MVPHVGFRKLKRDDALQMTLWAFDNQDRQQLETLVSALVSERDQTHGITSVGDFKQSVKKLKT